MSSKRIRPSRAKSATAKAKSESDKRNGRLNMTLILIAGLVLSFAAFLTYIRQSNPDRANNAEPRRVDNRSALAMTGSGKPKYDFYQDSSPSTATDTETEPAEPTDQPQAAAAPSEPDGGEDQSETAQPPPISLVSRAEPSTSSAATPKHSPQASGYMVQAGAFNRYSDADRRKAKLALLGIVSRIELGIVDGAEVHRVRVGPFPDEGEARAMERNLEGEGFGAFTLLVK